MHILINNWSISHGLNVKRCLHLGNFFGTLFFELLTWLIIQKFHCQILGKSGMALYYVVLFVYLGNLIFFGKKHKSKYPSVHLVIQPCICWSNKELNKQLQRWFILHREGRNRLKGLIWLKSTFNDWIKEMLTLF